MRFFRASTDDVYEAARLQLDAAWGHPTPDGMTITCITPAAECPHDDEGKPVLAVEDEFSTWEPAATMLPQLLASGAVEEIDRDAYTLAVYLPLPERP